MNKKVLVLGANGMLGHMVVLYLREQGYSVDALSNSRKLDDETILMDITDKNTFEEFLTKHNYDVIINAVGILIQMSDKRPDLAAYLNSYMPHQLENLFKDSDTKIIHFSTDCVFSGKHAPYYEDSVYDGETFYDRSKALGEIMNNKDLTLRQSIIGPDMNENGVGLFNWFMKQSGEISGYSKAVWNGITTLELAKGVDDAIRQNLTGLYQLVPNENITKFKLLELFNEVFDRKLIIKDDKKSMDSNKTLINTRKDFKHVVPNYSVMIGEMRDWMDEHGELYGRYNEEGK
ncbi:MAG: sugar nucleotide-binding protein [Candidatus Nomurabacteria bacterium]|jgi:dTDP-4-dehydrorhamnose reductase|nr:sugar nucleotide-binding protein [Candidatus Nomurabacteria bacterium]